MRKLPTKTDKGSAKESVKGSAENHKEKNNRKFFLYGIIGMLTLIAAGVVILFIVLNRSDKPELQPIAQSKYSISYFVDADPLYAGLEIDIAFNINKLDTESMIYLYKGLVDPQWRGCTDDRGAEVPFAENEDLVAIGPIDSLAKKVNFKYYAGIGVTDTDQWYETTNTFGCIFEDLLAFSGEYAFLLPLFDPGDFDSIGAMVDSVSIEFITPADWQPIIPYNTPLDGSRVISVSEPTWDFFNSISKSAFCFGHFEKFDYEGNIVEAPVYLDRAIMAEINQYALNSFVTFLRYYAELFEGPLEDVPIVLLRNHPLDRSVITGGVGSRGSAVSINLTNANDYRTLSNVVYHTFFDSKVKPRNLRYVTNEWIYQGLADYYTGKSAAQLPEPIRDTYSINLGAEQSELYLKYLYFSLKEPGFLAITPADESGMYFAQEEFYFSVKAPLVIDAINHSIWVNSGKKDGFIRALAARGTSEQQLDVEVFLKEECAADYEAIKNYIAGLALIPNYNNLNVDYLSGDDIVYMLDMNEQTFAYYFRQQSVMYPYAPVFLLDEERFMAEAEKRGIRYNSEEIQNEVKAFSPVLDRLLLQYAMWASFAGIDDVTTPNIIGQLTQQDVVDKWTEFCEEIGYDVGISSSF